MAKVSAGALADILSRLGDEVPREVMAAIVDTGVDLQSRLVQDAIAATKPHQPVDQGQYKGSWRGAVLSNGYLVYNLSKHAQWIERGQRPGAPLGVLYAVLLPWAARHGLPKRAAWAIANKIHLQGTEPRWVLKRANVRAQALLRVRVRRALGPYLAKG